MALAGTASEGAAALRMVEAVGARRGAARHRHAGHGRDRRRPGARRAAPKPPVVIFVTAFDMFAVAAFDVEAVDYVMKPVSAERLDRAVERARERLADARRDRRRRRRRLAISRGILGVGARGLVRLAAADVDRVSAERDYMRLHVGKRSWLINHTIGKLEEELDPERFVRLHRSAIVRRDFVTGLRRDEGGRWWARLADGERAEGRPPLPRQCERARRAPLKG